MNLATGFLVAGGLALSAVAPPAVQGISLSEGSRIESPCGQWKDATWAYYNHCDWNTHVNVRVNYYGGGGYNFCDDQPYKDVVVGYANEVLESVFTGYLC